MHELSEMQQLLQEIAEHLKSGTKPERRMATVKLRRIAAIATTLGFTIQPRL